MKINLHVIVLKLILF